MAETGSYDLGFRLDIKQILTEAQHRWLRPAEICEILRNYVKFHISPEAPSKPVSGSVFLFDRKVLRYFRKDGHNWRKKRDGKTVKEAHEKLKVGSVDMLHCYYAHGEDNENFQRRSYWLLEPDLMHIVFVHYLEVKGNKTNSSYIRNNDAIASNSENNSPLTSSFRGTSPTSTLSSGYEDAESEDNHQASSRLNTHPELLVTGNSHSAQSSSYNQLSSPGNQNISALNYASLSRGPLDGVIGGGNILPGALTTADFGSWQGNSATGNIAFKQEPVQDNWQHSFGDNSLHPNMNQDVILGSPHDHGSALFKGKRIPLNQGNDESFFASSNDLKELSELTNFQGLLSDGNAMNLNLENGTGNENYPFLKRPLINSLQSGDSLKKVDSFSRWIAKELAEADDLNMQSSGGISWSMMGSEYDSNMSGQMQADVDTHSLSPSISQDQLFSIIDISPNWAYSNMETKVLLTGTFLKSEEELSKFRWSIMFGEMEVPAEALGEGILCCCAPLHKPGLVPFYVTCSNRLGCSEIREFEYRLGPDQITPASNGGNHVIVMHLYQRFETILSLGPVGSPVSSSKSDFEKQNALHTIILLMEEEHDKESSLGSTSELSLQKFTGQLLLEKQLKQKFYSWLVQRVSEDGNGITVIDERGQSVLHLAAALGFSWAFQPILVSGVSIDFRDANGWTALHWAAFYGREETVATLVSLGAAPGALTDPSTEHPSRTPADLAASSGHKGISGYLAEGILTTHLSKLEVNDQHEDNTTDFPGMKAIQKVSERLAVPTTGHDVPDTLSLQDSLAAVCNAAQAAARIHQIFRVKSFQRKQLNGLGTDEFLTSDEQAASLVAAKRSAKTSRLGHSEGMASSAALQIQKKFRGYKKRKEFLLIREKIVKIQAHVRGHQVRKKYKPIIWSVGILEKVILRWRRKGSGLRGFRSDEVVKVPEVQSSSPQEDDYDFLKDGRKQTEERMQKALSRVKSMAQYPEARAQYRRLLTTAEGLRETKDASDMLTSNPGEMIYPEDDLIDIESLFDNDALMSLAFD